MNISVVCATVSIVWKNTQQKYIYVLICYIISNLHKQKSYKSQNNYKFVKFSPKPHKTAYNTNKFTLNKYMCKYI